MTLRRLAQLSALALAGLTYWMVVSRPGVIGDDFVGEMYAMFAVLTLVVFGVCFLALRLSTSGTASYWRIDREDQLRPIAWMILAVLALMQVAFVVANLLNHSTPASSEAAYLLAGTLVPAAFVQSKLVAWPSRVGRPGWLKLSLLGTLVVCAAAGWSYIAYTGVPDPVELPSLPELLVTMGALIIGATVEEVLFRVLLLTALLDRTGSRFQAVFLSSVAFGLMHAPGALLDAVIHGEWAFLAQNAFDYAPQFLMQTALGLFLGVIWLRTGSITLIALTHALLNLGNAMAVGLLAYG